MGTLDARTALNQVKSGQPQAIYLCWGNETYLMREFVQAIVGRLVPDEYVEFALSKYSLRETPLSTVLDDAETPPFMVPHKVIIADEAIFFTGSKEKSKAEHDLDRLQSYILNPAEYTTLIFTVETDKLDERRKIVKMMKDRNASIPFSALDMKQLQSWVEKRAGKLGMRMEPDAVEYVIANTGARLQQVAMEIDKLAQYAGQGGVLTLDDAKSLVVRSVEHSVFVLIDEIVAKRTDRALSMFYELLQQKEEPIKILALVARQFRLILQVKSLAEKRASNQQIAGELGVPPFAVYAALKHVRNYTDETLASIMSQLAELDYRIKTGKVDKVLGMEMFLLRLSAS